MAIRVGPGCWNCGGQQIGGSWLSCLEESGECKAHVDIWAGETELGFEGDSLELLTQAVKQRMMKVLRLPALRHWWKNWGIWDLLGTKLLVEGVCV